MCVIAFAWNAHPRWRLLLVGNRDELHARASAPLAHWADAPRVVAGRDLQAGGTWMGVRAPGRAAVVTNVRDPAAHDARASRGLLVADFLRTADPPALHAAALRGGSSRYRPFNLLLFGGDEAVFVSNHPVVRSVAISDGVHGLANGDLDAAWPKVAKVTGALARWLARGDSFDRLFAAFADATPARDAELPDTGVGIQLERRLSPVFVRGQRYGTRATTLIALARTGGGCIRERRFGPDGVPAGDTTIEFAASADG